MAVLPPDFCLEIIHLLICWELIANPNVTVRDALTRRGNLGELLAQFIEHINRYSPGPPGVLQGQTAATLVRNWGVPVTPQRHVIDQGTTRWVRQPLQAGSTTQRWEMPTSAMGRNFVLYDPRTSNNGDLWGVYAFQN